MNRTLILAITVTLVVTAPAQAKYKHHKHRTLAQLITRYTPRARSAWPGSPCAGRETVVVNQNEIVRTHPTGSEHVLAFAYTNGSCRVVLSPSVYRKGPLVVCDTLVHEFGHLAGYKHNTPGVTYPVNNPLTVMGEYGGIWEGCYVEQY